MTTITSSRPAAPPARAGFAHLLHAEWTKFRTVRGWVIAVVVAVLVTVLLGLFQGSHSQVAPCTTGPNGPACRYVIPAAGRRAGDRHLLLRAPPADKRRQHHGTRDVAD